jgi:hypothetical protein
MPRGIATDGFAVVIQERSGRHGSGRCAATTRPLRPAQGRASTRTSAHADTSAQAHADTQTSTHARICGHRQTHTKTHSPLRAYRCTRAHTTTHTLVRMHAHAHAHTTTRTHTQPRAHARARARKHNHAHSHTTTRTHTQPRARTHNHAHAHTTTRMHAHSLTDRQTDRQTDAQAHAWGHDATQGCAHQSLREQRRSSAHGESCASGGRGVPVQVWVKSRRRCGKLSPGLQGPSLDEGRRDSADVGLRLRSSGLCSAALKRR